MKLRVGLVVPHIFMQKDILPHVIFSPGQLALDLTKGLGEADVTVTLFTPGPIDTIATNVTADLAGFQRELAARSDTYLQLLKKHPLTFITLSRQVQAELIAKAYQMANNGELDVVHIYTNEEDIALPFAQFCKKPVVFTHHDPFNFLVGYRSNFYKYTSLNWLSISNAQRAGMPDDTNWVDTIYHGLDQTLWPEQTNAKEDYLAYFGRIIEPKGVEVAIHAVQLYNETATKKMRLEIAGKYYGNESSNSYWQKNIEPALADPNIEYVGFITDLREKQSFLANAKALIMPSVFDEPFGMVAIEALACSTPVIGLDSGAIPELIDHKKTGLVIKKSWSDVNDKKPQLAQAVVDELADAIGAIDTIDTKACRAAFLKRFTLEIMAGKHKAAYEQLAKGQQAEL